jgi:putative cardiolipin synthase
VRLYNPLVQRDARVLNFMTDFTRVNHRMHNKSFTIDNQVAVVGGRNIGNEYFALGGGVAFSDLDVVGIGDVVREVSREFDTYWNSPSAYPAAPFVGASGPEGVAKLKAAFAAARTDPESVVYLNAVRATAMLTNLVNRTLDFEWTTAKVLHDDPAKTLDTTARTDVLLLPQLMRMMGPADRNLDMISPYFVPGEGGTAALVAAAGRGVQIRILTNSLSSTDESAVHAGYAKRRVDLLRAGVKLYEMKATQTRESREETSGVGSSGSVGLHAKTLQVNGERIFVGSFNLDQRSAKLNTEMGIVIDSPTLAQRLARAFDNVVPQAAYEVRLKPDGQSVQWIERTASGETAHDTEPATSWSQRSKIEMLSVLPIEWLL